MAEKVNKPSSASSWDGQTIKKKLKTFRFDPARIYSHKNETILIHAGNIDILEEVIDYEMGRKDVLDRGVLVVRLSDEIRPVLSDESVVSFLLKSGDHEKSEQLMRPTGYVYENVYHKDGNQFPTGIMCQPTLIKSVKSGKSVTIIDEEESEGEKKSNDPQDEKSEDVETSTKTQVPVTSKYAKVPCLGYSGVLSDELHGILRNGSFVLKKHNDSKRKDKCPCSALNGEECSIDSLDASPDEKFSLLHWAYLGHCRLLSFRQPQGKLVDRDNHEELKQFEKILGKLLEGAYSYEYMIYEGLLDIEVPFSSQRYDMGSEKNLLDDCFPGDARGGISFPWSYIGTAGSIFPTHVEDIVYLNSVNLMIYGSPKIWIFVGPSHAEKLHKMVNEVLNTWISFTMRNFFVCTLLHKMTFVHPALLDIWGIPYTVVVQKPGDLLYTCAGAFHWGCNLGVNVNVAKNCIHYDFKMRLLKELYDPAKDIYMCRPNCAQSFCRDLDKGVIARFLLSFYKSIFKGERYTEDEKELISFLTLFYSSKDNYGSTSAQKMDFVGDLLRKKMEQIAEYRKNSKKSVLKKIQRLQCSVIREVTGSFTFSFFKFASEASEPKIFPCSGVTLTTKQEKTVLDRIPYTHIVVQHTEYGTSEEMCISNFEEIKPEDESEKGSANKDRSKDVKRLIQSYSMLNNYWTNVEEGKDYEKVMYRNPDKDHYGFLLDLDVIRKRLVKADKDAKEEAKRKRNDSSVNSKVSESSSFEDDESDENDEEENCTDFALLEKKKLRGTAGFRIVETCGRLIVVEVAGTKYFICTVCFNFDEEIIEASKDLVKKEKEVSEIEIFLKKKLDGKNGVASLVFNMREHIKKWCEKLQCKHRDCTMTFNTKHSLALHVRGQHQSHLIFCPLCNLPFTQPSALREHWCNAETACVKVRFYEKEKSVEVVGFQCSNCSKAMSKIEHWDLHLEQSKECREKLVVENLPE